MKLIVEKYSITGRDWKSLNEREVPVKVTPKRIEVTSGLYRGKRFDRSGRCIDKREPLSGYRYSLDVSGN